MLKRLYISNVVLADKLELDFAPGLSVMTGETGAGKSMLLDALSLALGAKADANLIRGGAAEAVVVAEFDEALLKRSVSADGKSKCWIDGEPATQKALKDLGDELLEIHGQFSSHSLLDDKTHIHSLDLFGAHKPLALETRAAWGELRDAEKKLAALRDLAAKSAAEREFLNHSARELELLKPAPGEEAALAKMRQDMMDMEKNSSVLKEAAEVLGRGESAEKIFAAAHILERTKSYRPQIDKLYDIGAALAEIVEQITPEGGVDVAELEAAEERLFALRAAARKHRVAVDELPQTLAKMLEELARIDGGDAEIEKLEAEAKAKRAKYDRLAANLTQKRVAAAAALRAAVKKELPDLKLGAADFAVEVKSNPAAPTADGNDAMWFAIRTNPGSPFAPLSKIASGGELSRFMLALRVVLFGGVKTLVFDEIDAGISGATATAVGERLAKLADSGLQIIAITHSAQVAGCGDRHFLISKRTDGKTTTTGAEVIDGAARVNEIARIISGAKITPDSVKAAKNLIRSNSD